MSGWNVCGWKEMRSWHFKFLLLKLNPKKWEEKCPQGLLKLKGQTRKIYPMWPSVSSAFETKWLMLTYILDMHSCLFVFAGLRLNNAWASGTVLRPFLQPESPLSSRSSVSGFKCKLRDSNSQPPYSWPRALTTRLYTIHIHSCMTALSINETLFINFSVKFLDPRKRPGVHQTLLNFAIWISKKSNSLSCEKKSSRSPRRYSFASSHLKLNWFAQNFWCILIERKGLKFIATKSQNTLQPSKSQIVIKISSFPTASPKSKYSSKFNNVRIDECAYLFWKEKCWAFLYSSLVPCCEKVLKSNCIMKENS